MNHLFLKFHLYLNFQKMYRLHQMTQMNQMRSGISSASQGELKGVPESNTATGVNQIISRGAVLVKWPIDQMKKDHNLDPRSRLQLEVAAILHDIGTYIATQAHHKHSMYLIRNSELFGLGERHLLMVALIARYHRKAPPQPDHEEFMLLDRSGRVAVLKLAAILRVADALDRSHECRLGKRVAFEVVEGRLRITCPRPEADWSTEEVSLEEKGDMLNDVFGLEPVLQFE